MSTTNISPINTQNHNLEQLRKYAEWDKREYPDSKDRQHVLDWAVQEIERLREEIARISGNPF